MLSFNRLTWSIWYCIANQLSIGITDLMVDSMILSQSQKYSLPTDFIWKFNPYFLLQQNHHYDLPTLPLKIRPLFPSPTKLSFQSANFTSGNSALIFFTNKTIIAIHQLYLWKFNPYFLLQQNYHYDLPTLPLKIQPLFSSPTNLLLQSTNFTSENSTLMSFSNKIIITINQLYLWKFSPYCIPEWQTCAGFVSLM